MTPQSMWEQDDWNSCEDLTLCHTDLPASGHHLDGETTPRQPYRYSSYPVGCAPGKITKENEASDKRKSDVRGQRQYPKRLLVDCIKHKKRAWMKAVGRFLGSVRQTNAREPAPKRNSKRPGEHHTGKSNLPNQSPHRGAKASRRGKPSQASPSASQEQHRSFTKSIRKRFSRPVSSSHLKCPRVDDEERSRKPSSLETSSISTKSSTSLPFNRPEDFDNDNTKGNQDFRYPFSLPRLDTLFEPFSFEPSEFIEELK